LHAVILLLLFAISKEEGRKTNNMDVTELLEKYEQGERDFRGAHLSSAHLSSAHLSGAHLEGAHLEGAHLEGAHLDSADLDGATLRGATLDGAYLKGANLDGAYLRGAYLDGATLDGATLRGATLDGAYLRGAYLKGANLDGAYLKEANLDGAYLKEANLRGAYLRGANLRGAYLKGANLNKETAFSPSNHEAIAEILRQAAGASLKHRMTAGLVLMSREWCWTEFAQTLAVQLPDEWEWALKVLEEYECFDGAVDVARRKAERARKEAHDAIPVLEPDESGN
jgi:uncharacterized protein YjbI with pentapeptide repeats